MSYFVHVDNNFYHLIWIISRLLTMEIPLLVSLIVWLSLGDPSASARIKVSS